MQTFWSLFARLVLKLAGWRILGAAPPFRKVVVIAGYHTSNWDGLMLVLAILALKVRIVWVVKRELMRFPLSIPLGWLGAMPIDRLHGQGVVDMLISEFNRRDDMVLVLSPEGTRRRVKRWRRGFYAIAEGAHVPILMAGVDYKRKVMGFGSWFIPSGDLEADLEIIRAYFKDFTPRHPENAGPIAISHGRSSAEAE